MMRLTNRVSTITVVKRTWRDGVERTKRSNGAKSAQRARKEKERAEANGYLKYHDP